MPKFTPQQEQAVFFKDGNCLVSAGAGSGKTAVLTERIYWLIVPPLDERFAENFKRTHDGRGWSPDDKEDPVFQNADPICSPTELLVLTFGKGAAIEMKERVKQKLSAHKGTRKYLPLVEEADISNFDSFFLKVVNDRHFDLGLPSRVSIVDETYVKVLTKRIEKELIEEKCSLVLEGKEESFAKILKEKCVKSTAFVIKGIDSVLYLSSLAKDPDLFFETFEETYLTESFFESRFAEFESSLRRTLREMKEAIYHLYDNGDLADLDAAFVDNFINTPDFDSMHETLFTVGNKFPSKPKSMEFAATSARDAIKKHVGDVLSMLEKSKSDYLELAKSNIPSVLVFLSLAKEVHNRKKKWMSRHSCYDFAGVANLMQKLLSNQEVRKEFSEKYRYIMVDEYQDTSNTQEDLIQSIARDNVFAVGDIKQSIYRFRKANPKTFHDKLIAYGSNKGGKLITLPDNFRSREEVITEINRLFERIMTETVGGVNYSDNQALAFGNKGYSLTSSCESYGLHVLKYEYNSSFGLAFQEARHIANDIKTKVESGFCVHANNASRPCQYGDFAVLISRKSGFGDYVQAFKEAGIPVSVRDNKKIGDDDVVIVIRALLTLIDMLQRGEWDEIIVASSCLSLARSFLFRMSDDEIYSLFRMRNYGDFPFFENVQRFARDCRSMPIRELFKNLLLEFRLLEKLPSLGEVEMNYREIVSLLSIAESLESNGQGLSDFIAYLADLEEFGFEMEVDGGALEKSAVKVMTDHYSKGLQYKICYFPELVGEFNSEGSSFLATSEYGITLSSLDESGEAKGDFLGYLTKESERRENISERMRLFYVALTRAEEMIVLVLPDDREKEGGKNKFAKPVGPFLSDARSFADFFRGAELDFPTIYKPQITLDSVKKEPEKAAEIPSVERILVKEVSAKGIERKAVRASASLHEPIDQGSIAYGNRLHRVMELTDFGKKRLPELANDKERAIFEKVLAMPIFEHAFEGKEYHEYEFHDPSSGLTGSIDLFIVYEGHIDLIDYKSSTIDSDKYGGQLTAYASYLRKAFPKKRIDKYLLSIGKAELKRVD